MSGMSGMGEWDAVESFVMDCVNDPSILSEENMVEMPKDIETKEQFDEWIEHVDSELEETRGFE